MTRKQKIVQKGGMHGTPLPSEVFGKHSGRYYPVGSAELNISNSAYGANIPTSRGAVIGNNLSGPELGPTNHSGTQTGGRRLSKNNARRRSKTQSGGRRRSKTQSGGRRRSNNRRSNNRMNNQQGGNPFRMITNPETGRNVSIHGSIGKKVLMNYLNH